MSRYHSSISIILYFTLWNKYIIHERTVNVIREGINHACHQRQSFLIDITSDHDYQNRTQQHSGFNLNEHELSSRTIADLSSEKLKSQPINAIRNLGGRFCGSLIMTVVNLRESNVDFDISNFCRDTFSHISHN